MMYYLLMGVSLLVSAYFSWKWGETDIHYSSLYNYYGQREKIRFSRDKYGGFNENLNRIGTYAYIAFFFFGAIILDVFFERWVFTTGVAALLGVGLYRKLHADKNWRDMQEVRTKKQIPLLEYLRQSPVFEDPYQTLRALQHYGDRRFYRSFAWIYSTADSDELAKRDIEYQLMTLAKGPVEKWFPK